MSPLRIVVVLLTLLASAPVRAQEDAPGTQDHPLFNRMPGFLIDRQDAVAFDAMEVRDAKGKPLTIEGKVLRTRYTKQEGVALSSRIQIHRNYENAIKKVGGTVVFNDGEGNLYLRLAKDGREFHVRVGVGILEEHDVDVVEREAMAQVIVADAASFAADLRSTGHVAVYGIYFETGKADVKAESGPALVEIAKLLKADAALKLYVVGHTDSVGSYDANVKLSQARAEAVLTTLTTRHAVAASRLRAVGVASVAPVASNRTEEGRAKNRRVELVEQ